MNKQIVIEDGDRSTCTRWIWCNGLIDMMMININGWYIISQVIIMSHLINHKIKEVRVLEEVNPTVFLLIMVLACTVQYIIIIIIIITICRRNYTPAEITQHEYHYSYHV